MHITAVQTGRAFFDVYGCVGNDILDVGSLDINGTLRPYAPPESTYIGVDMADGPGVDVLLEDPYKFPFIDGAFDISVSTSCFEHDAFFWETFLEMARVTKFYIYLSAPIQGPVHRHPLDCWRFYPDAGLALAAWARRNGLDVNLIESFMLPPVVGEVWADFVAVFASTGMILPKERVYDRFPTAHDIYGKDHRRK